MSKVYTGYHGTSETEYGLCACTVDNSWGIISLYRRTSHALSLTCIAYVSCTNLIQILQIKSFGIKKILLKKCTNLMGVNVFK